MTLNQALLGFVLCGVFLVFLLNGVNWHTDYDSTDDVNQKIRSKMELFIDHETGCEYLGGRRGGIIERTNHNGEHMGCK